MTKLLSKSLIITALAFLFFSCEEDGKRLHISDVPFAMEDIELPSVPAYEVLLTDYGAVGDGKSLCTEAFRAAFDDLEENGGGTLVVTAYSASAGTPRGVAVVDVRDTEEVKNVDAQEDLEFTVKAGTVYIYPKAGVRFVKFHYFN